LSSVKNLSYLVRIAGYINLVGDIFKIHRSNIFNHIGCGILWIEIHGFLTVGDRKSLTEALNDRLNVLDCRKGTHSLFPNIENYDGRGQCWGIMLDYISTEALKSDHKKVEEWARSRGWDLEQKFNRLFLWRLRT